jgi:hypothetical protein
MALNRCLIDFRGKTMTEHFRFDVSGGAYVAWAAALSVIVLIAIVSVVQHQLDRQAAVLLGIFFCWYAIFGALFLLQNATLVLSPSGLERFILGIRVRRVAWSDIRRIREFALFSRASGRKVIWIKVDPMAPQIWQRAIFRSITFPSRTEDYARLIRTLNTYATQYNVEVEKKIRGEWIKFAKLSDRVEDFE